ncbi:PA4780 family RIO1-like protein kinase [Pelagibaculum spongiae]|uniref:non-specific serine/threonine protein kinase n=1 Tax=Pelagibaculum spongiae TaxID=2080658 RepID=A0A2V1GST5_9GAMM|nr:PA4780 family RIO1-like protein kinase [Pelagibaculum spongiae]PVZ67783.1 serine protein kinase RIO [Pelagibaculum spongiae]
MKIPKRLQPLVDDGIVDKVLRQLMSGKEATVYVVQCGDEVRCAKVYKDVSQRSFKNAVLYNEGRKVRNGRNARAMQKGSKFGLEQQEEIWQNTEIDALYKFADAGIRVPQAYGCFGGILLMELITDADGFAAPRLNDVSMSEADALTDHATMMDYVVRMLSVGVIHGDLSEFNVLVDANGPVVIDLPQAVDAAGNNNARKMLLRDVNNMTQYYSQFAPSLATTRYGEEIWEIFEAGDLSPKTVLTGEFADSEIAADVDEVLHEIDSAFEEELGRREGWLEDIDD